MSAQAFRWEGDGFKPLRPKLADQTFVVGKVYWLDEEQRRSSLSERHEFAWIREAWKNLPEKVAEALPTPDHLRKRALIDAGFYDETIIDAGTQSAALRVASFARSKDGFAYVVTRGPLVVVREAKSQSRRAMDGKAFQASKTAIMEIIAGMIGVSPSDLETNAGKVA